MYHPVKADEHDAKPGGGVRYSFSNLSLEDCVCRFAPLPLDSHKPVPQRLRLEKVASEDFLKSLLHLNPEALLLLGSSGSRKATLTEVCGWKEPGTPADWRLGKIVGCIICIMR
jgi:hypothetical protein